MNQKIVAKYIDDLKKLKDDSKTAGDPSVRAVLARVKSIFGIESDELSVVVKAADRIFKTELKERD
jgi:GTP1/Obg family GTP-binding protein